MANQSPGAPIAAGDSFIDYGMFTTVSLIDSYTHRWPIPSLIRDTFFTGREFMDSEVVRIDSKLGGRQLAPFILPLENQVIGRRQPFREMFIPAPILAPARVITPRELRGPSMGENVYNYKTPEERFAELVVEDGEDMEEEITRREEWMCANCMFTGRIPINYRNKTDIIIDYGFVNRLVLTKPWTDPTAEPLEDLREAQGALNLNGYGGDIAIYSPSAWRALWTNPTVKDAMKNVFPQFVPFQSLPGTTQIGFTGVQSAPGFTSPPMTNWIYYGTYATSDPDNPGETILAPYVPDGAVCIGSSSVRNRIVYGMVTQIEQDDGQFHSYMAARVPKVECNVNKNFYMQTITSRPVPVPLDLLAWTVIEGTVPASTTPTPPEP